MNKTGELCVPPHDSIRDAFLEVPTPSLVYDMEGIERTVSILKEDVALVEDAQLNMALKATHTHGLLNFFAEMGLGADVASFGEYDLACKASFSRITATGPSFTATEFEKLARQGVMVDATSLDQLAAFSSCSDVKDVGLRVRIDLPDTLDDNYTTFGSLSRFGVNAADPRLFDIVKRFGLRIRRLHTHTGQTTTKHLVYKVRYLLAIASHLPDVDAINVGGGFFSLYLDRQEAASAWRQVNELLRNFHRESGRRITLIAEPGGALLSAHGYLVAAVMSVEPHHSGYRMPLITMDASAWNLVPWHQQAVVPLQPATDGETIQDTLVAGSTLYENDFFGTDTFGQRRSFRLPEVQVGSRLVFTASGAYSMTNSRQFNRIPLPSQFTWRANSGLHPL